jgi:hypothetical protein
VLGDFWQSLQRGTLGPDLVRWGLNEYRTNPLWQRQFTDAELRQLTIDLAKRGEFGITGLLRQIVDEKGLQHWLTGQVDYAVQALRDPRTAIVMGFNLGVGLVATGIGAATLPAIAAVAVGSLVANVAFQTWVESGGGLNFNLEAFRSSLGINSAATVPGLIGGMIGARFGPWGRIIGSIAGAVGGQFITNAIQGRPWDEGLLFNMGLSVGTEGVMMGVEGYVDNRLRSVDITEPSQGLRASDGPGAQLRSVEPSPLEGGILGPEGQFMMFDGDVIAERKGPYKLSFERTMRDHLQTLLSGRSGPLSKYGDQLFLDLGKSVENGKVHFDGDLAQGKFIWVQELDGTVRFTQDVSRGQAGQGRGLIGVAQRLVKNEWLGNVARGVPGLGGMWSVMERVADLPQFRTIHPMLSRGAPVRSAGEMMFDRGRLMWLDNGSGHYQPKLGEVYDVRDLLVKVMGIRGPAQVIPFKPK